MGYFYWMDFVRNPNPVKEVRSAPKIGLLELFPLRSPTKEPTFTVGF
jgi:hypothetical protein